MQWKRKYWNELHRSWDWINWSFSKVEPMSHKKASLFSFLYKFNISDSTFAHTIGQSKDVLVDMIQHGAEKIINNKENMLVDEDIESIIQRGQARTAELNAKYSGLDFDDLANFKTETNTQQWEGEDYAANGQAKKKIGLTWIEPAKRERKLNYSENISFRDMLRGGPVIPKKKKGPKKINTYVCFFAFFFWLCPLPFLLDWLRSRGLYLTGYFSFCSEVRIGNFTRLASLSYKTEQICILRYVISLSFRRIHCLSMSVHSGRKRKGLRLNYRSERKARIRTRKSWRKKDRNCKLRLIMVNRVFFLSWLISGGGPQFGIANGLGTEPDSWATNGRRTSWKGGDAISWVWNLVKKRLFELYQGLWAACTVRHLVFDQPLERKKETG